MLKFSLYAQPYHFVGELAFLNYEYGKDSEASSLPVASADAVVETEDTIVWEWEFSDLKEFLEGEREVSNALSAYVNHDLRKKLIDTGVSMAELDDTYCNGKPPAR